MEAFLSQCLLLVVIIWAALSPKLRYIKNFINANSHINFKLLQNWSGLAMLLAVKHNQCTNPFSQSPILAAEIPIKVDWKIVKSIGCEGSLGMRLAVIHFANCQQTLHLVCICTCGLEWVGEAYSLLTTFQSNYLT